MRAAFLLILLVATTLHSAAQDKRWCLSAGGTLAYVNGHDDYAFGGYRPAAGWCGEIIYAAPLGKNTRLLLGAGYLRKGFREQFDVQFDSLRIIQREQARYDMLSIPLRIAGQIWQHGKVGFWLAGGINYGFLLQASTKFHSRSIRTTVYGQHTMSQAGVRRHPVSLAPPSGSLVSVRYGAFYLFNPALSLELMTTIGPRLSMRLCYEYTIYDAAMYRAPGDRLNLNNATLLLGIRL